MADSKKAIVTATTKSASPPPPPAGHSSPTLDSPPHLSPTSSIDMALVAHNNPSLLSPSAGAGINKRYRPAPAKTFQCRGYGECRMVFSRSEHLARHIRKHTGERPFSCHCGKQFSRLDNLRQHAQTVHADKQDQNEQMMRDLTSLHATMAAANKAGGGGGGGPRSKRGGGAQAAAAAHLSSASEMLHEDDELQQENVKQEDMGDSFRGRPGTSTGYEGDHNGIIYQGTTWHVQSSDMDRAASRPTNNHSFRDPSQSFLAPPPSSSSSNSAAAAAAASSTTTTSQSQSFLGFSNSFNFVSDFARDGRPGSSSSRPPTASGGSLARTLPPLAAVVSAALPSPPPPGAAYPPTSSTSSTSSASASHPTQHILPIPGALAFRRPGTANRPGTAPASYFASKSAYAGGAGLVDLSVSAAAAAGYGRVGELAAAAAAAAASAYGYDAEPTSPTGPSYESPFSFHPPSVAADTSQQQQQQPSAGSLSTSPTAAAPNPRKRPYPGSDGDDGSSARRESGGPPDYEYGTESRPQSRRLSLMELCNDPDPADAGPRALLSAGSRPTTSSGLAASASTLALVDRTSLPGPHHLAGVGGGGGGGAQQLLAGAASAAAGAAASTAAGAGAGGGGGGGAQAGGGGRVLAESRGDFPSPSPSSASSASPPSSAAAAVFHPFRGSSFASSLSDASRAAASSSSFAARRSGVRGTPSPDTGSSPLPRRGAGGESHHDQVRVSVASPHSPTALGMRV